MEKFQYFNGLKFTRDERTGYYLNSTIRKRIHQYVWEYFNGRIPEGYQIHHKDKDRSNNCIENLECISKSEHLKLHGDERNLLYHDEMVRNLKENALPKAIKWHKSVKGKEWHKKHYKKTKESLYIKIRKQCEYCLKEYETVNNGCSRFCSAKCKAAWRRKSGIDDETRQCKWCGNEFTINKYSKKRYCSKSCSNKAEPRLPKLRQSKVC